MSEQTIPTHVYTVPDAFNIWLADNIKLDIPDDKLHLGMLYQLVQATVKDSRIDEEGNKRWLIHCDSDAEAEFPASIWSIPGEHCWSNAKEATVALLKRRIAEASRALDSVLKMPGMIDKHDGLLDGQDDEGAFKYDRTTGDTVMLLTTRIAPVLGSFVSDVTKLLIQYRRLRKEEQKDMTKQQQETSHE